MIGGEDVKETKPFKVTTRIHNDNFYDDYLHRGDCEPGPAGMLRDTPLRSMSLYVYAIHVRIVKGDPEKLQVNQYPFSQHHVKRDHFVQELRPGAAVPFIHGYTMPTAEKDADTNALFKQVLLRPHHCHAKEQCRKVNFTRGFCQECRVSRSKRDESGHISKVETNDRAHQEVISALSSVPPWRQYHAQQQLLARRADDRLRAARRTAVLPDTTILREWWLPEAVRHSIVQDTLVPWLMGHQIHATDSELRGAWCRREPNSPNLQADGRCCWRPRLSENLCWQVLRFAGHIIQDDGHPLGIANNAAELRSLRTVILGTESWQNHFCEW